MSEATLTEYDEAVAALEGLPDSVLAKIGGGTPWQLTSYSSTATDEDGFSVPGSEVGAVNFQDLQQECWEKFEGDPFVSTTVSDNTGRIAGLGFEMDSSEPKISEKIEEVWEDPRNNLVSIWKKYLVRSEVQGELYLALTVHSNGFVEVDRIAPGSINGFDDGTGILSHPEKSHIPLMYRVTTKKNKNSIEEDVKFIPSIYLAHYPDMWSKVNTGSGENQVDKRKIVGKVKGAKFKKLKDHQTFIVSFDRGYLTKRNIGQVRTVLHWLNRYDDIKKWELDHKRSSGAYLWAVKITDMKAFRTWIALSEEDKQKTGLTAKKTPGGTLILPPGFELNCHNPKLSSITNQDGDILSLISAGLNTAEDSMTGTSSGTTYSGVKMSRGPMADRTKDNIADVSRFLIFDFWRSVFLLANKVSNFPLEYKQWECYKFVKGEPKMKYVKRPAHKLVEISFPVSEIGDVEDKARAFLGVKHGAVTDALGVASEEVAHKLGFTSYRKSRLRLATEKANYPELKNDAEITAEAAKLGEAGLEKGGTEPKKQDGEGGKND